MLLDFSDCHKWSDYVRLCQMVLNSQERKALNASPICLIFGSDTSPRLLPNQLLSFLPTHPLPPNKLEFIEHLQVLSKKLTASCKETLSANQYPVDMLKPAYCPQVNETTESLFCARGQTSSTATL
ncbi:hypothetical protein P9112_002224 [Eukaryota sp. TZLM1-RC]